MKVAVINCGSEKVHKKCKAKDLYIGSLFLASRFFCESNYDKYCILSAKYHCLLPDDIVDYYDLYLGNLSKVEKQQWDLITAQQLIDKFPKGTEFDFYTSKMYIDGILPILQKNGISYTTNLNNLGLGYKIQWFQQNTKNKQQKSLF